MRAGGGAARRRQVHAGAEGGKAGAPVRPRAELALIHREWEAARGGAGGAVLIEGDAGVGKTRLHRGDASAADRRRPSPAAACFEHLQAAPLTPWMEAAPHPRRRPTTPVERRTETSAGLPRGPASGPEGVRPLLNPLLNLALPQPGGRFARRAGPSREAVRADRGILPWRAAVAAHAVVLEDLHWMDDSSLALAGHLAGQIQAAPLCF